MRKQHGPDLARKAKPISRCVTCHGRGVTKGVFYELACDTCAGTGWVDHATGQAMPAEDLVFTLSRRLLQLEQQLAVLQRTQPYESSNRRGPHGSHFTGD